MQIHFDHYQSSQNVDNDTTSYRKQAVSGKDTGRGYQVDISGTVMDNNAYRGHGKTTEDVMQEAGRDDVALKRNYMAVMSNSMSAKDFAKLQEEGFHPGSEDVEEIVTIVDKIKAELLRAGEDIKGYTDTLDMDELAQITGSESYANAIVGTLAAYDVPPTKENITKCMQVSEKASKLEELSGSSVKYMIENEMDPSIRNLYVARYGTNGQERNATGYYSTEAEGYYARKAETIDWEQLAPSMEQVVKEAAAQGGYEAASREEEAMSGAPAMEEAKWLVEQGVELTPENLNRLHVINRVVFPLKAEDVLRSAAIAIADGIPPEAIPLNRSKTAVGLAAGIMDSVEGLTGEAADLAAAEAREDGAPLNLKALKDAQGKLAQGYDACAPEKNLQARRMLEEVRLRMTVEANLKLIKSNYSIETAPIEELVEELKQAEYAIQSRLMGETEEAAVRDKTDLYRQTMDTVSYLPGAPAAVTGRLAGSYRTATLEETADEARDLQRSYEKAGQSYEALMTAPRRDLGDHIGKAFRNVDDILGDMGLEATETNRRAVRILGYNTMDISYGNIAAVKAADLTVRNVVDKMTPSAVLTMIREGKNPLRMTIGELDQYFSGQQDAEQEAERYSKFLYKLEKNDEITEEEKTSFIGIYRMLRQLEKSDGAAVGSLVEQNLPLTFSNLMSAVRTARKGGIDRSVDDQVDGIVSKDTGRASITDEIEAAFRQEVKGIRHSLTPEGLRQAGYSSDMAVEALYDAIRQEKQSEQEAKTQSAYEKEQIMQYQHTAAANEAVVEQLLSYGQPVTADYIMAAQSLLYKRGGMWKQALGRKETHDSDGRADDEGVTGRDSAGEGRNIPPEEQLQELHSRFTSREEAQEAYIDFVEAAQEELEYRTGQAESYMDVREMMLVHKQLSFSARMAKEESYEVPVMINGSLTSINLKLVHEGGGRSKAAVTMETEGYGRTMGEFSIGKNGVTGYLTCENAQGQEYLGQVKQKLLSGLKEQGFSEDGIYIIHKQDADLTAFMRKETQDRQPEEEVTQEQRQAGNMLYNIAKIFIGSL